MSIEDVGYDPSSQCAFDRLLIAKIFAILIRLFKQLEVY
jgi:hypothetical protein